MFDLCRKTIPMMSMTKDKVEGRAGYGPVRLLPAQRPQEAA
ncbi:hypothetical protein [Ancylobacter crimeensis]|nr:hypothetical protein [Ancylobacter crimeensis]